MGDIWKRCVEFENHSILGHSPTVDTSSMAVDWGSGGSGGVYGGGGGGVAVACGLEGASEGPANQKNECVEN